MTNKEIGLQKIQELVTRFNEQLPATQQRPTSGNFRKQKRTNQN
jgi:hypothetical protein